jgi:hypothetical protein
MSRTRDIQKTLKALKEKIGIARLPSSEEDKLGNVATKLEFTGQGSFAAVHSVVIPEV